MTREDIEKAAYEYGWPHDDVAAVSDFALDMVRRAYDECAAMAGNRLRWGRTIREQEMCTEIAAAIREAKP